MRLAGFDRQLASVAFALMLYGLVVLYSAGQTDVATSAAGIWHRQFVWFAVGLCVGFVAFNTSFRLLEWVAPAIYALGLILLIAVLVVGTGAGTAAGTKSWLAVGGHRIGQPAEFAKLATVLMLARYLSSLKEPPRSLRDLWVPCAIIAVPFLLVMRQPDLGSAIVFIGIFFAMLFWAGVRPRMLFMIASPGISLLMAFSNWSWGVWIVLVVTLMVVWRPYIWESVAVVGMNIVTGVAALVLWNKLADYQKNRLLSFLNPEADPRGAGYQALQSKTAIGSGGWFGSGLTEGPQKRLAFLPEQHTDFVFSVVGEELGFIGVVVALGLFMALLFILVRIARRATDPFSSLVVFGIAGLWFSHIFENVGMTINIMPITGIPLPFFSYGGSFFLICCICLGLCLRVAWDSRIAGYAEI
ncbi:MAG TPA: rod shape-determining protein RodA [Gemmatimonadales bacterium]|nr:rod shape-determining protein RodA [Gemmatimonadales bacterium]